MSCDLVAGILYRHLKMITPVRHLTKVVVVLKLHLDSHSAGGLNTQVPL